MTKFLVAAGLLAVSISSTIHAANSSVQSVRKDPPQQCCVLEKGANVCQVTLVNAKMCGQYGRPIPFAKCTGVSASGSSKPCDSVLNDSGPVKPVQGAGSGFPGGGTKFH